MDNKLKETLNKVKKEKQAQERQERAAAKKQREDHDKYIKSQLPAAQRWVDENLFDKIAEQEKYCLSIKRGGKRQIFLRDIENGIPAEAIIKVADKIDGLHAYAQWGYDRYYECDSTSGSYTYIVEWESPDPNDHRND